MNAAAEDIAARRYDLYIDGEWRAPAAGRRLPSLDPSNGEPWYELADAGPEDVDAAVKAARAALSAPAWRRLRPW